MRTLVAYIYLFLGQYTYPESYLGPGANQSLALLRPVKSGDFLSPASYDDVWSWLAIFAIMQITMC